MNLGTFLAVTILAAVLLSCLIVALFFGRQRKVLRLNVSGVQFKDWKIWDRAIDCFAEALSRDPKNALSHYNLGFVLYFGKNLPEVAKVEFEKAIACDPLMAAALYSLGHLLYHCESRPEDAGPFSAVHWKSTRAWSKRITHLRLST